MKTLELSDEEEAVLAVELVQLISRAEYQFSGAALRSRHSFAPGTSGSSARVVVGGFCGGRLTRVCLGHQERHSLLPTVAGSYPIVHVKAFRLE